MELQLQMPSPAVDFDFPIGRSSPHLSAPSTPRAFGTQFYFSAPTSPARTPKFDCAFEDFSILNPYPISAASCSASPSCWEERANPDKLLGGALEADDFAFDVRKGTEKSSVPAEELFHDGKIKPQETASRLQYGDTVDEYPALNSPLLSPVSTRSSPSHGKKPFWSAFLPERRKETNTFPAAANKTPRPEGTRGRGRESTLSSSRTGRRGAKSLSPVRVRKYPADEEQQQPNKPRQPAANSKPPLPSTAQSLSSSSKGSRRWRLKDFLLFRSASEGRTSDKDPFRKYAAAYRKQEDIKNSGHNQTDSHSHTVPTSRRRPPTSAHEMHYNLNRAVSEDLKKKTFLPYKRGILGRLAVNPAVHALANGFGSLTHS
ncbi:hypothetical protein Ancab_028878 [Ancistrocladus abbreviatus]